MLHRIFFTFPLPYLITKHPPPSVFLNPSLDPDTVFVPRPPLFAYARAPAFISYLRLIFRLFRGNRHFTALPSADFRRNLTPARQSPDSSRTPLPKRPVSYNKTPISLPPLQNLHTPACYPRLADSPQSPWRDDPIPPLAKSRPASARDHSRARRPPRTDLCEELLLDWPLATYSRSPQNPR